MGFWSKFVKFFTPPPVEKPSKVSKAKVIKEATVKLDKFDGDLLNGWSEDGEPVVKSAPKRARTKKGRYVADDKSTPDVNEAWVGGKAPKKKAKAKKKVSKIKDNTLD